MKNNLSLIIITLVLFGCTQSAKIEETDEGLKITKKQCELNAKVKEVNNSRLFYTVVCDSKKFSFTDGAIAGIDIDTALELKSNYGSLKLYGNPGSKYIKESIELFRLMLKNPKDHGVLKKVDALIKEMKFPIVEMTYDKLEITKCNKKGKKIHLDDQLKNSILVDSIRIVEDDFAFYKKI